MNVYHAPTIGAAALPAFQPVPDTPQGKPRWNDHPYHFFATRCPVLGVTVAYRVERLPGGLAQLAFKLDGEDGYKVPTHPDRAAKPITYDTAVTDHLALVAAGYATPCFRDRLAADPGIVAAQWPIWMQLDDDTGIKVKPPVPGAQGLAAWPEVLVANGPLAGNRGFLIGVHVFAIDVQPNRLRKAVENWVRM